MRTEFAPIEDLISRLDECGKKESLMASLSWSFGVSYAQAIARLHRVHADDDPRYSSMNFDRKAETVLRMENQIDELRALYTWAYAQAEPDYRGDPEEVVERISEPSERIVDITAQTAEDMAKEFGRSVGEIKRLIAENKEREAEEQEAQTAMLANMKDDLVKMLQLAANDHLQDIDDLDIYLGAKIADRIAEKASIYSDNAVKMAMRQRRERRRAAFTAQSTLLKDIERRADKLLTKLEGQRDSEVQEDPTDARTQDSKQARRNVA